MNFICGLASGVMVIWTVLILLWFIIHLSQRGIHCKYCGRDVSRLATETKKEPESLIGVVTTVDFENPVCPTCQNNHQ